MIEGGGFGADFLGGRRLAAGCDTGLGQGATGHRLAATAGQGDRDVGAEDVFLAAAFARHLDPQRRVGHPFASGASGGKLRLLRRAPRDAELVAVFADQVQPFASLPVIADGSAMLPGAVSSRPGKRRRRSSAALFRRALACASWASA